MPPTLTMIQATVVSSFRNQVANNVLHYRYLALSDTAPSVDDLDAFTQQLRLTIVDDFKECLSQDARYEGLSIRWLSPGGKDFDKVYTLAQGAGPGTADTPGTAPSQVCGLIRKRTEFAGRRGRGRFYMPFVPEDALLPDDLPALAYRTLLSSLGAQLIETLNVTFQGQMTAFEPGIASTRSAQSFTPIVAALVANGFATQRRRGYFGRPNVVPVL